MCYLPLATLTQLVGDERTFWRFYRKMLEKKNIVALNNYEENDVISTMRVMMQYIHEKNRTLYRTFHPDNGQSRPIGWLAIKSQQFYTHAGYPMTWVRAGDVFSHQPQWDRDVFLTHSPSGGNGPIMSNTFLMSDLSREVGVFMPLYDQQSIHLCVDIRLKKNLEEGYERLRKEAGEWGWPEVVRNPGKLYP